MLRDSLHQPQYVEKLEKIVRFVTKEKSLTLHDLDMIWEAQVRAFSLIVDVCLVIWVESYSFH